MEESQSSMMEQLAEEAPMTQEIKIPPPKSKRGLKIALAALAVLIIAGGAGAGYWVFLKDKKAAPEEMPAREQMQEERGAMTEEEERQMQEGQAPVMPQDEPQGAAAVCDEACFLDKFTRCETAEADFVISDALAYHDRILGINPENGLCRMSISFGQNPNPDFLGKEMICEYPFGASFFEVVKERPRCDGELYDTMNNTFPLVGTTPQETLDKFIAALLADDIRSASALFDSSTKEQNLANWNSLTKEEKAFIAMAAQESIEWSNEGTATAQAEITYYDDKNQKIRAPIIFWAENNRWYIYGF